MKILYGLSEKIIDVTEICYDKLKYGNSIIIPCGDINRAKYFSDPIYGVLKKIFIVHNYILRDEYNDNMKVIINLQNNEIKTININDENLYVNNKISHIHSELNINYGSFNDELPEQKMVVRYLTGLEKVLEIGGNIGRNSLVIGYLLRNNINNFVALECDNDIANQLRENRDINNMNFHIEQSALSKRNLIQRGWDTFVSDIVPNGYKKVNAITLEQLQLKYNIEFDTLVLDCEGAFYYILIDMPEILNNINLIIMENDYHDINHKKYIDNILKENNFYVDYCEEGGWGPCYSNFFEVWKRSM